MTELSPTPLTDARVVELIAGFERSIKDCHYPRLGAALFDTLAALRELQKARHLSSRKDKRKQSPTEDAIIARLGRCESSTLQELIDTCFAASDFIERTLAARDARMAELKELCRESRDAFDCLSNKTGEARWNLAIRIDAALTEPGEKP